VTDWRLGRFRETLPDHEKATLDTLMITAEGARWPAEVQGYQRFWGREPLHPQYHRGVLPGGENYNMP
jgi:hypothetical protein